MNAVAGNELELGKAFLLIMLDNAEIDFVYKIPFKESGTNINEAKETIGNLLDLRQIRQKSITELLASGEVNNILSDSKTNKRQKGEMVYKLIKLCVTPPLAKRKMSLPDHANDWVSTVTSTSLVPDSSKERISR